MPADTPTAAQLSEVISQVTAPSFLLGAVAAFISLQIARMNRIIDMVCSFVLGTPCQLHSLAGQEHGRTIPLADFGHKDPV